MRHTEFANNPPGLDEIEHDESPLLNCVPEVTFTEIASPGEPDVIWTEGEPDL
jgi:hypothetical protein